jgi:hypothetical protein
MILQSILFRGDQSLQAAAVSDQAHICRGAKGDHVAKIQAALNILDEAALKVDGDYGPKTARAVLSYKTKRNIINRSYQQSADDIVGRMTIAALDRELTALKPLEIRDLGGRPAYDHAQKTFRALAGFTSVSKAKSVNSPGGAGNVGTPNLVLPMSFVRHDPNTVTRVRVTQTAGFAAAVCENHPDPSYNPPKTVRRRVGWISDWDNPRLPDESRGVEDGGQVPLTKEPHFLRFDALHPGDASIKVSRPDMSRMLVIDVRQGKKGPVGGAPLTRLTAGSQFFSTYRGEFAEGSDPQHLFKGRPVNPKRGGRLINLAGELETPEFEDYQVDLDHSAGNFGGFRPWTEDLDRSASISDKSASHITMRNTPLLDSFVKVIKRIAMPGCRFTFFGSPEFEGIITSQIPGRQLERLIKENDDLHFTWEIS